MPEEYCRLWPYRQLRFHLSTQHIIETFSLSHMYQLNNKYFNLAIITIFFIQYFFRIHVNSTTSTCYSKFNILKSQRSFDQKKKSQRSCCYPPIRTKAYFCRFIYLLCIYVYMADNLSSKKIYMAGNENLVVACVKRR